MNSLFYSDLPCNNYRSDPDLEFLSEIDNDKMKTLVDLITTGKYGDRLTSSLKESVAYRTAYPDNCSKLWQYVAAEIQLYGGDTIINSLRGRRGVLYKEILVDVAKRMKVNFNKKSSTAVIEKQLLDKVLTDVVNKMSDEERKKLAEDINRGAPSPLVITNASGVVTAAALIAAIKLGGITTYYFINTCWQAVVIAMLGRGVWTGPWMHWLAIFAGPIGWIITGLLTVPLISAPAYRVTVPAVILIASFRALAQMEASGIKIDPEN